MLTGTASPIGGRTCRSGQRSKKNLVMRMPAAAALLVGDRTDVEFCHGLCSEFAKTLCPEYYEDEILSVALRDGMRSISRSSSLDAVPTGPTPFSC